MPPGIRRHGDRNTQTSSESNLFRPGKPHSPNEQLAGFSLLTVSLCAKTRSFCRFSTPGVILVT
ncbi:hypothetical protein NSPZN2_10031 [Nitrospira defluvii]|uniref:Uncharacterized protein n=1 Tax=Nitrospira defluvii TaxID=330214 RepID=A0ABM8QB69_9BACT|nr:hypothetical protein NSPZN2_10031 [Nitrospira defluvii]